MTNLKMKENSISVYVKKISDPLGGFIKKAKQYLYEVRAEINKIMWPERDKATKTTYVVLIFIVIVTAFLGIVDLFFSKIIYYIFHL